MVTEAAVKPEQIITVLQDFAPFNSLNEHLLKQIARDTTVKRYPRGSYVFRRDEASKKVLFVVIEGQAKIITAAGEQAPTDILNPGDFFGVTVFLSDDSYPASVVAVKDLTCLLVSQRSFVQALSQSRDFANYFTLALAGKLKDLYRTFMFDSTEKDIFYGQPLRKRIEEVARTDVVTCLPLATVHEVARDMSKAGVSSVVVVAPNQKPLGIITQKDLVTKVLAAPEPGLDRSAYEIMSGRLITAAPRDFTYQALLLMVKHKIKHVVVMDRSHRLCGIVTVQDLVRNRNSGALTIVNRIEQQEDTGGLAEMVTEIDRFQEALINERAYASEICALVTELYDRITRKIILLAEAEMVAEGWGEPPVKYCFINMGSSGRKEQYARTDQDNGIVYQDTAPENREAAARYFLTLGEKIVSGLEACGFHRCKGGVMANTPRWCRSLSMWRDNVRQWIDKLDPGNIRDMTIFLDFRHLSGEAALSDSLREYVTGLYKNAHHALLFMAEDDLKHRVPLNMFKQIITERSGRYRRKLNLKTAAGVHILDCIRLFALREGIAETNTFERIKRLRDSGVFKKDESEFIEAAYETLMMLRIRDALQKAKRGLEPDNYIDPYALNQKEQSLLKESLLVVNRLQSLIAHAFRAQQV